MNGNSNEGCQLNENLETQAPSNTTDVLNIDGEYIIIKTLTSEQNELEELLNTWRLPELYSYLDSQNVYIDELKLLIPEHIALLLKDFNWSIIIKFTAALKRWQLQNYSSDTTSTNSDTLSSMTWPDTPSASSQHSLNFTTDERLTIPNLSVILMDSHEGTATFKELTTTDHKLTELKRDNLSNVIVNYYIRRGEKMTTNTCHQLAEAIVALVPSEDKDYYYLSRKNASPLGKLYFKYHNQIARLKRVGVNTKSNNRKTTNNQEVCTIIHMEEQQDSDSHYQALRNEVLGFEELLLHWKGCSKNRLLYIKNNSTADIFAKYPNYKESDGYKLVAIDYLSLYPTPGLMLNEEYTNEFFKKICQIFDTDLKDPNSKQLYENLKNDSNTTQNGQFATTFILLHAIIKNNPVKIVIDENGKKKHMKYSIKECQNNFVYLCESVRELEQHFDKLLEMKQTVQPFICIIGKNMLYPKEILVYLDGIKYKVLTIFKAIDVCFKSFHIFNLKYPAAGYNVRQFLQIYFFKLQLPSDIINPSVKQLIKKMEGIDT